MTNNCNSVNHTHLIFRSVKAATEAWIALEDESEEEEIDEEEDGRDRGAGSSDEGAAARPGKTERTVFEGGRESKEELLAQPDSSIRVSTASAEISVATC